MTPEKNSFQLLAEEEAKRYPKAPPQVEQQVTGTMGFVRMVSNVVELYLPRAFDMMLTMIGGNHKPIRKQRKDPAGRQDNSPRG